MTLDAPGPHAVDVKAGELLSVELVEGAQIVNLFMLNASDPDERVWAHETCLIEGLFLTRYSRLWGTMARFRPLLTVLEDTVTALPNRGMVTGKHHPVYGGSGTPADWRIAGGRKGVMTTWEQFAAALEARKLSPGLIKDNACLFQKTTVDGHTKQFEILRSDALRGDRITFFAEIDLTVLLALSPYIDGSRPPRELGKAQPRAIEVRISTPLADPLPWPYPQMPYPDLSLYLNADGVRSEEAVPTPGRG